MFNKGGSIRCNTYSSNPHRGGKHNTMRKLSWEKRGNIELIHRTTDVQMTGSFNIIAEVIERGATPVSLTHIIPGKHIIKEELPHIKTSIFN